MRAACFDCSNSPPPPPPPPLPPPPPPSLADLRGISASRVSSDPASDTQPSSSSGASKRPVSSAVDAIFPGVFCQKDAHIPAAFDSSPGGCHPIRRLCENVPRINGL
ncbi:hypothetical protein OJAV_G00090240 [Oryzias javanicus]|uniref:Uncharacterized protein n=1 Tax=Oryzias javanicus TaxID=123683 RepID=A0A437D0H6_ORYJA|nr:hypothetical protein OJAV_G00090240 [Oryzias javanicus]